MHSQLTPDLFLHAIFLFAKSPSRALDLTSRLVPHARSTTFYLRPANRARVNLPVEKNELDHEFHIVVVSENMVFSCLFGLPFRGKRRLVRDVPRVIDVVLCSMGTFSPTRLSFGPGH
jgi:hypothetical protein